MSYKVTYKRHIAKTISYRIISTTIGVLAMWWATGSFKLGAAFGVVELVYKPLQYYIHERIWYRWIKFGLVEEKKPKVKKIGDELHTEKKSQSPVVGGKKVLNYTSNR